MKPEQLPVLQVRGEPIVAPAPAVGEGGSISAALARQAANSNAPPVPKKLPRTPGGSGDYAPVNFTLLARFIVPSEIVDRLQSGDTAASWKAVEPHVPEEVRALNGRKVAVAGFMLPTRMQGDRASEFLLLRNQNACCFGMMPRVNEMVVVRATGQGVHSVLDTPIAVSGTLHVRGVWEGGRLMSIYEMDCDQALEASAL